MTRGARIEKEFSSDAPRQIEFVQRQIGHRLAEGFIFPLKPLQRPQLIRAHSAVLLPPPVILLLSNANLPNRIYTCRSLYNKKLYLLTFRNILFCFVSLINHL